jgi:hypothetical protein
LPGTSVDPTEARKDASVDPADARKPTVKGPLF